jgi:L-ascorbate metabolism protein UlaG (beta-lactamase superfamily)
VRLTLVRHATLLLDTRFGRVLVDPMLDAAGARPPIEDTPNQQRNPLVELPMPPQDVVAGVDLCIVTHLHQDHFDATAADVLPKETPILTQPESADALRERGFTDVRTAHDAITMTRGRHGSGARADALGPVSGWVVDGIYVAGDTVWCDEVRDALERHRPRIVVLNGSGAHFNDGEPVVMDADDVRRVQSSTDADVVVVHLEAINHCLEPRAAYRAIDGVRVPDDGETLEL